MKQLLKSIVDVTDRLSAVADGSVQVQHICTLKSSLLLNCVVSQESYSLLLLTYTLLKKGENKWFVNRHLYKQNCNYSVSSIFSGCQKNQYFKCFLSVFVLVIRHKSALCILRFHRNWWVVYNLAGQSVVGMRPLFFAAF